MIDPPTDGVRLCVCADDFGLHAGVNEAVSRLADSSRLHAVGALVGAPAWNSGAAVLRRLDTHGLDIGLHLDFTEFPVLPGSRKSLGRLLAQSLLHRLSRAQIRAEIRTQLDIYESVLGHGPAFVDGHQHVHQLPGIRDELLAELAERYGKNLPWIRRTRVVPESWPGHPVSSRLKACVIEWLGARRLSVAACRLGFSQNRGLLGVYDFAGGQARYSALLRAWLRAARDADLLMCHPGLGQHSVPSHGAARAAEYQVLSSRAMDELVRESGIVLCPMSRILARQAGPA